MARGSFEEAAQHVIEWGAGRRSRRGALCSGGVLRMEAAEQRPGLHPHQVPAAARLQDATTRNVSGHRQLSPGGETAPRRDHWTKLNRGEMMFLLQ